MLLKRFIRVRKVVPFEVQAFRGITAGSGSAVTEMKLVMINIILKGMQAFPLVVPSCFVDDLSAEMTGPDKHTEDELGFVLLQVANNFCEYELELSSTKCLLSFSAVACKTAAREMEGSQHPLQQGG